MFDEDYKKFVMGLMKPGDKLDSEISNDEEELLCNCLNIINGFKKLSLDILNNGVDIDSRAKYLAIIHMSIGVIGEIGEVTDCVKKAIIYRKPIDVNNFIEEIGDLCFYLCALGELLPSGKSHIENFINIYVNGIIEKFNKSFKCTITIQQCIEHNKQKLSKRYAQGKYTDEQAKERADKN
jgi:hypothetical protein